ncbi:hypothetical protein OG601_02120 [Streptomyces sp. NBC_01239]|uniref:hypothetical protein n=1 Tax=Streptomyces sp. NBC_01239 TaxID=2903792 RepID=UPI00224FF2B7|nr:hypothetical protein [Streptomyces sp. NBC_01239]MCX4809419.1 hypothetical protein [Streptomyces sp. NBC_01239]
MSNQPPYPPQQPGRGNGQPPYGQPPFQPEPPKKRSVGKVVGLGCLGIIGLFVVIGIAVAAIGGGSKSDSGGSGNSKSAAPAGKSSDKAGAGTGKNDTTKDDTDAKVVFKVWGTAPAGALGGLDIGYGSDSDTRKGTFKDGRFEATLTLDKDAMYYHVNAQLQGSGDINCSVTADGKTKKGHASGGYNICNAQLSSNFTGGWS